MNKVTMPDGVETIYKEFGQRLRRYREGAGLSQQALAERLGLSRTSVTNIEKGNQRIPLHVALKLANVLGVNLGNLLPDDADLILSEPFDEVLNAHQLAPRAKEQVRGVLRSLSEEDQRWVGRVITQTSTEGRGDKSRATRKGTAR